jgi:hypothetical protein
MHSNLNRVNAMTWTLYRWVIQNVKLSIEIVEFIINNKLLF